MPILVSGNPPTSFFYGLRFIFWRLSPRALSLAIRFNIRCTNGPLIRVNRVPVCGPVNALLLADSLAVLLPVNALPLAF
jgi:hypothetical protein